MAFKIDREEVEDLLKKLRLIAFIFLVELQCLNILFPISLIFFSIGVVPVNIVLSSISSLLLIFTIVRYFQENQLLKTVKRVVDRVCRIIKILAKAVSLGISIYGIIIIIRDVNWFSVLVVVLSSFLWIVQVIIEVVREIIESQLGKFTTAVKTKTNEVKDNVTNIVKCIKGDEDGDKSRVSPNQRKALDLFEKGKATLTSAKNTLTGKNKKSDENK